MTEQQKNNPGTGASGNEIIREQIKILRSVNQKLLKEIDGTPLNLGACTAVAQNISIIHSLVGYLGPFA